MEAIGNLIMGDPVYDCKGRVVRRNFGIKNIVNNTRNSLWFVFFNRENGY